ncbi:MAG: hypothetical protein AB7O56_14255 [Bauldia sp.]
MIGRLALAVWLAFAAPAMAQDAKGGLLLYQLDVHAYVADQIAAVVDAVDDLLGAEPAETAGMFPDPVRLRIDAARFDAALRQAEDAAMAGIVALEAEGPDTIVLRVDESALAARLDQLRASVIDILGRRLDRRDLTHTIGATIEGWVAVDIRTDADLDTLAAELGATGELGFHVVRRTGLAETPPAPATPDGIVLMPVDDPGIYYEIDPRPAVAGSHVVDAAAAFDFAAMPVVTFRLDEAGTLALAAVTRKNVGRPFAIVLDGALISAPQINEAIVAGTGVIQGNFSVEETERLAALISAGALPIPVLRVPN